MNLITLIQEKFTGKYLLDFGHAFALFQGQGLFGWSKVQGNSNCNKSLFRNDRLVILVLLFSTTLGVRATALIIMLIFIMQNLNLRVLFSHLQKWHVLLGLILISYFVFQ